MIADLKSASTPHITSRQDNVREKTSRVKTEHAGGEESTLQGDSSQLECSAQPGSDYRSFPSTPSWVPPGWYEEALNQSVRY